MSNRDPVDRFAFGANWRQLVEGVTPEQERLAAESLVAGLGTRDLSGMTFLDIGCGSGLFSLAARRCGARVTSFDFDPDSVACAQELRRRYQLGAEWEVLQGSVLDEEFLQGLGEFDVVYAWGVLHHTGHMWDAIDNAATKVAPGGRLFVALYNDQGWVSRIWTGIKKAYVDFPFFRPALVAGSWLAIWGRQFAADSVRHRSPAKSWREYGERGMSPWRDLVDWVGGYPFETTRPEPVISRLESAGFTLEHLTRRDGRGNHEFVFRRN